MCAIAHILAGVSDIAPERAYAQVEGFVEGLEKLEAISIACAEGIHGGRPV
jgi:hypothetical protein